MSNTTQSAAYGYTTAAKVYRVKSSNGEQAWYVAATPGEALDAYASTLGPPQALAFPPEDMTVTMCQSTDVLTTSSVAGTSSGVSATCAAWATTYNTSVAAGLSGTNSSIGTQALLLRTS